MSLGDTSFYLPFSFVRLQRWGSVHLETGTDQLLYVSELYYYCGVCSYSCDYLHGDLCEMCNRQCLNPFDPEQRKGKILISVCCYNKNAGLVSS